MVVHSMPCRCWCSSWNIASWLMLLKTFSKSTKKDQCLPGGTEDMNWWTEWIVALQPLAPFDVNTKLKRIKDTGNCILGS